MRTRRAFTLVEMLVVIAIIGLLAGLIVPQIMNRMDEARSKTTRLQVRELENAINLFKMDNGFYPSRMEDLVTQPANAQKWPKDGYLKEVPRDGWGNAFQYLAPGTNGPFDLISYGADNRPGGDNENTDITNYATK